MTSVSVTDLIPFPSVISDKSLQLFGITDVRSTLPHLTTKVLEIDSATGQLVLVRSRTWIRIARPRLRHWLLKMLEWIFC
jgi:hypothetical protein